MTLVPPTAQAIIMQWKARTAEWTTGAHLPLQLSHCGREVEHQPGDVLQLVLQDLDGICLLLVLERTHGGQLPCTDIPVYMLTFISNGEFA